MEKRKPEADTTPAVTEFVHDALVIRTVGPKGESYGGFMWPMAVGEVVECPDWSPTLKCGNGFHGLLGGLGDWALIDGSFGRIWQVVGVVRSECVSIDENKVKFPRCRVLYVGDVVGAMNMACGARRVEIRRQVAEAVKDATTVVAQEDREHASAAGACGHASAAGIYGHASAAGIYGHASATGDSGHASAAGDSGHASAVGDSGHASAVGDSGHASAAGRYGHASAAGVYGHASAAGVYGHASAAGVYGHASAAGVYGHASAAGVYGHASAAGVYGHASAAGVYGHASAAGRYGHASAAGVYGHASAAGVYGHASAAGRYGHASVKGKHGIAAAVGKDGTAMAGADGWIVLSAWGDWNEEEYPLIAVKAAKVGGPEGIQAGVAYRLSATGEFISVSAE